MVVIFCGRNGVERDEYPRRYIFSLSHFTLSHASLSLTHNLTCTSSFSLSSFSLRCRRPPSHSFTSSSLTFFHRRRYSLSSSIASFITCCSQLYRRLHLCSAMKPQIYTSATTHQQRLCSMASTTPLLPKSTTTLFHSRPPCNKLDVFFNG
ncbi:hypothetical protein HN873_003309 [Arachis hypogaea]